MTTSQEISATDEGAEKSLAELWGGRLPPVVNHFVALTGLIRKSALRLALVEKEEFVL